MTPSKENIIKQLFELSAEEEFVSNKEIAQALDISPPSVSEMLLKLSKEGYIEHVPYRGCRLSERGEQEAIKLLRYHRLWEVFLIEQFGYSWSEAHEEAHLLEHVTSAKLAKCLDAHMNFPAQCPHGVVAPEAASFNLHPLSAVQVGEHAEILSFTDEPELLDYMEGLGLRVGMSFDVLKRAAYEGPLLLKMEQGRLVELSYKASTRIFVR